MSAKSKGGTKVAKDNGTVVNAPVTVTPKATKPGVLQVKAGGKFRGARDAWYQMLQQYDGKPVAEFLAAAQDKPPSVPKSGVAEKPSGWLRYFQRTQFASVVTPQA